MDTPIFYIFLFIHLASLILGFGSVLVIDTVGLLFAVGKARLPFLLKLADTTQRLIWAGWILLVLSGINLLILKGFVDNLTKIKLFFVILLGLNGIYLHIIKKSFAHLPLQGHLVIPALYKFRIALATAVSQLGWWGAILIGFAHRHWQHYIAWPESPLPIIAWISVAILVVFVVGECLFSKK